MSLRPLLLAALAASLVLPAAATAAAGTLSFSTDHPAVVESDGQAVITVVRSGGTDGDVSATFATADGTAAAGSDYTGLMTTVMLGDGVGSANVAVQVLADGTDEANETVALTLSDPAGGATIAAGSATLTIADDDEPSGVVGLAHDIIVRERAGIAVLTVVRTRGASGPVTVRWRTTDVTAAGGADYTPAEGTVTLADNQTVGTIGITLLDDEDDEPAERFVVDLFDASGAPLGRSRSTVTVEDDDAAFDLFALGRRVLGSPPSARRDVGPASLMLTTRTTEVEGNGLARLIAVVCREECGNVLTTATLTFARRSRSAPRRVYRLSDRQFVISRRRAALVAYRLGRTQRRLLARRGRATLRLTIDVTDSAGTMRSTRRTFVLESRE